MLNNVNTFFVSELKSVYKVIRGTLYANEICSTQFHLVKHLNTSPAENQVLNCAPMSLKALIRPLILSRGKCAQVKKHLVKINTERRETIKCKCLNKQQRNSEGNALWLKKQSYRQRGKERKLTQGLLSSRKKFKIQLHY